MTKVLEKISKEDAVRNLYSDVSKWINSDFNYVDVSVFEKMADDNLYEYILQTPLGEYAEDFQSYLTEEECKDWITDFLVTLDSDKFQNGEDDIDDNKLFLLFYNYYDENNKKVNDGKCSLDVLKELYGDAILVGLQSWLLENKEDEIREFAQDDENYPMWNTLCEFKSNFDGTETNIKKAQEVGLGIIDGLEPFNTTLFAMSCGHSFYASYWIPLYLSMWTDDNGLSKYGYSFEDKDYQHL